MTTRFGIPPLAWLVGLSAATFLSVVAGIIAGAVHGAYEVRLSGDRYAWEEQR